MCYTLLFGYIIVALVWFILGAIINPNIYLMYATSAITLITFVLSKAKLLFDLAKAGKDTIT